MTETEMKEQIQTAQDLLEGMQNQRNAQANECVQLAAQIKALQRRNAELEARLAEATTPITPALDGEIMPKANGHDIQAQGTA